jgi:hypothetical protein
VLTRCPISSIAGSRVDPPLFLFSQTRSAGHHGAVDSDGRMFAALKWRESNILYPPAAQQRGYREHGNDC